MVTAQQTGKWRLGVDEAVESWHLLNKAIFDDGLDQPEITVKQLRKQWGACSGWVDSSNTLVSVISLHSHWPTRAMFIEALAHEMVHQFQWDVLSDDRRTQGLAPIMSHGPTFFAWRKPLAQHGIKLSKLM